MEDVIELDGEVRADAGDPLLTRVMVNGRRTSAPPALADLRARSRAKVAGLPETVRRLRGAVPYPVRLGERLRSTIDRLSHVDHHAV